MRDNRILKKSIKNINKDNTITKKEKEKRIALVEEILKEQDKEKRYSKLYDMICDYLDYEFMKKSICGFSNDLCSRRRDMISRGVKKENYKNGCCYSYRRKSDCKNLKNGRCSIKNIGCKLFTCFFLRHNGKRYRLKDIYFARYFFNIRQSFYVSNTFFVDKDVILKGILERM